MKKKKRRASELTVIHDSGWVPDNHHICWDATGCFFTHPPGCPEYVEDNIATYLCSPGVQEDRFGVTLDDLPSDQMLACMEFDHGAQPVEWRVREICHPDMDDTQHAAITTFEVRIFEEEIVND